MNLPHLDRIFARTERRRGGRRTSRALQSFRLKFETIAFLKRTSTRHNLSKTRIIEQALAKWRP